MHSLRNVALVVLAALLVPLAVVACDDDEPAVDEEATENLCADLEELKTSIGDFNALSGGSTLEEVEAARDEVGDGVEQVRESAADVADAQVEELESAYDDFSAAVDDIDGDDSVAEAIDSLQAAANDVFQARDDVFRSVNCAATQEDQ